MPNFNNGPVPSPGYGEEANQFSQATEFTDDVYVYGKLYANIEAGDIDFSSSDNVTFNSITIQDDIFVSGFSTFIAPVDMDYLTVFHRHNVGASGTVFVAISSTNDDEGQVGGRVGIGSTQPDGLLQVGNNIFIVTDVSTVGIATTQPAQRFQVGVGTQSLVVTGVGTLGVGTASPGDFGINNEIHGQLQADFDGSIRIGRNLYDSSGSPGQNGFFMNRDANGIRWVSFTPVETEGVFLQNDGVYVPSVGAAQSFTVLNFQQRNSFGSGTDTIEATAQDPTQITGFSTIFTQDFWGYQGSGGSGAAIYRMSRVGINENNPQFQLDVNGTVHATNNVDFDSELNVDGQVTFKNTLDVDGKTTFNETSDASSTTNASVQIDGGVGIVKKLFVGDDTKIEGATESTSKDTGALIVEGGVGVEKNLNIGGSSVITGRLDVNDGTESTSTTTGGAVIDGGLGIGRNINVGGAGVIAGRLDVDDTTQSNNISTGAVVIDGGVGIAKNLNVGQQAKIEGNLELDASLIDINQSNGVGVCKTDYRLASVGTGVSWRPSGVQTKRTLYVTKNGCDTNSGLLEGDAKFTIGAAAAIAQEGDTIKVRSGVYIENNPIGLRTDVAITGEDLRLVTIVPSNTNKDVFHVRRGCLVENLSFAGASITTYHPNCGGVAFPPTQASVNAGTDFQAEDGIRDVERSRGLGDVYKRQL